MKSGGRDRGIETVIVYRRGALDLRIIKHCLAEIIRRHEIWRTTFDTIDGEPAQVIETDTALLDWARLDLTDVVDATQDTEARKHAADFFRRPFDLAKGPLVRFMLVTFGADDHRLCVAAHKLVCDAASLHRVFLSELASLYAAFSTGQSCTLPAPSSQYANVAIRQRRNAPAEMSAEDLAYWRRQLSGRASLARWASRSSRPAPSETYPCVHRYAFSPQLSLAIRAISQEVGIPVETTLTAAFATVLSRYTGQKNFVLGRFDDGRRAPELETAIGCFTNPGLLRIDLSGEPTFYQLQKRVSEAVCDTLAHQNVPLNQAVRTIRSEEQKTDEPAFRVAVTRRAPLASTPVGWHIPADPTAGGPGVELLLEIEERAELICGSLSFDPDVFDRATIVDLVGHWQTLLGAACDDPESPVTRLPLLTPAEENRILHEWNETSQATPAVCVHELFEAQARHNPDAVALVAGNRRLTFGQLDSRANQLARHLRQMGVQRGVLVAVYLERSLDMIVGLLGILKAGGAYLPLDPTTPREDLRRILADAQPRVLITHQDLAGQIPSTAARRVWLDAEWDRISAQSGSALGERHAATRDPAYLLYTAESASNLKGILVDHRSVVNLLLSVRREPGMCSHDVLVAASGICSEAAGTDLFLPLICGGQLIIADNNTASNAASLKRLLEQDKATLMQASPATWRSLLDARWIPARDFKILCTGEALPPELARELTHYSRAVWNLHGPTETTGWSFLYRVTGQENSNIPIGRPIANTKVYILDSHLNPVPAGIAGELYIAGHGLAHGYLNKPELTMERFVPNPFASVPGALMYRSGNLARWRPGGTIEYLGRIE
jgi:amino acid adenylation domain-containing protein